MQSSRALGVFALAAVILAAISFAAVDVVITTAAPNDAMPVAAVTYALIGTFALLASVVPAFVWFVRAIEHPHHDAEIEPMPVSIASTALERYHEEDL